MRRKIITKRLIKKINRLQKISGFCTLDFNQPHREIHGWYGRSTLVADGDPKWAIEMGLQQMQGPFRINGSGAVELEAAIDYAIERAIANKPKKKKASKRG